MRGSLLTEHQFAQPCAGATSIASPPGESRWAPSLFTHFPTAAQKGQVAKKPWEIHFDALFFSFKDAVDEGLHQPYL